MAATVAVVALVSSISFARPAHAEFFISKKTSCNIFAIIFKNQCKTDSGQKSSNLQTDTTTSQQASEAPKATEPLSLPPLDIKVETQTVRIPALPAPISMAARSGSEGNSSLYASVAYGSEQGGAQRANNHATWVWPTPEGWHLLGVAWYWWVVAGAALCAVAIWLRWRVYQHRPLLVK